MTDVNPCANPAFAVLRMLTGCREVLIYLHAQCWYRARHTVSRPEGYVLSMPLSQALWATRWRGRQ